MINASLRIAMPVRNWLCVIMSIRCATNFGPASGVSPFMESDRPLRILAVVNLPWDRKLGAPRVWIELAEQWRAAGHTVDKYCLTDAFPTPSRLSAIGVIRQV